MTWVQDKAKEALQRIREAQEKQVYPYFKPFESGGLHTSIGGKELINFSSNDYLGLTTHPKVKEASIEAVKKYSCGLSSSRVQATTVAHVELEERLAKWFGYEACLLFTTGYQAMVGLIAAIFSRKWDSFSGFETFLILPAVFLSGTFFPLSAVPEGAWQTAFQLNPIFYLVDGFRWGVLGASDASPLVSAGVAVVALLVLLAVASRLLATGYKLKP